MFALRLACARCSCIFVLALDLLCIVFFVFVVASFCSLYVFVCAEASLCSTNKCKHKNKHETNTENKQTISHGTVYRTHTNRHTHTYHATTHKIKKLLHTCTQTKLKQNTQTNKTSWAPDSRQLQEPAQYRAEMLALASACGVFFVCFCLCSCWMCACCHIACAVCLCFCF